MSNITETDGTETYAVETGIHGAGEDDTLQISASALEAIKAIKGQNEVPENFYLRIGTRGGGCSGMNYTLGFDDEVSAQDRLLDVETEKLVIDSKSLFYLMGVTLDYVDGPHGSGFVFKGYNEGKTCGCGG